MNCCGVAERGKLLSPIQTTQLGGQDFAHAYLSLVGIARDRTRSDNSHVSIRLSYVVAVGMQSNVDVALPEPEYCVLGQGEGWFKLRNPQIWYRIPKWGNVGGMLVPTDSDNTIVLARTQLNGRVSTLNLGPKTCY